MCVLFGEGPLLNGRAPAWQAGSPWFMSARRAGKDPSETVEQ